MRITVTVTPSVARALRGLDPPTSASRALEARAARVGLTLAPQHPRATDEALVGMFVATLGPGQSLPEALATLRGDPSVEGAWAPPPDALP